MNEVYTIKTTYGNLLVTKNAIGNVVVDAVKKNNGRAFVANNRGKSPALLSRRYTSEEQISNLEISFDNNIISIKAYVVIKFGTSIKKITNEIIDDIEEGVFSLCEKRPESITLIVKGMFSKKLGKRHIEVKREYEN